MVMRCDWMLDPEIGKRLDQMQIFVNLLIMTVFYRKFGLVLILISTPIIEMTVYAIYFAYRYFHDFGLGGEICDCLILCFW